MAGQWREIAHVFRGRQARYGTLATVSVLVVLGILIAVNYIGARQNKRWDLTANKAFSLSDQTRNVLAKLDAPLQITVFAQEHGLPALSGQAEGIRIHLQAGQDRVRRSRQEADRRQTEPGPAVRHDRLQLQGPHRARDVRRRTRAGHHQRHHQGGQRPAEEGVLRPGPRRTRHDVAERDGYNAIADALGRENYIVDKLVLAQAGVGARRCGGGDRGGPENRFLSAGDRRAQEVSRQGRQAAARDRSARQSRRSAARPT